MRRCHLFLLLAAVLVCAAPARAHAYDFEWIGKVALDAEGLKSPDPKRRAQAASALGKYEISLVKPYLLKALRDDSQQVREIAGRLLGKNKVAEAAPIVIEWLNDPDAEIKKAAADILADIGTHEAIAALIRTLGDVDPDVRLRAVLALGAIGAPSVVVPLVGRIEDDKADVRKNAIEQLQTIGDPRAVIPVVGAFNDTSVDVRVAAVTAVGHLHDPAAIPALLRLVDDSIDKVAIAAVASLGNLGATEAVDMLIDRLQRNTTNPQMRATLAYALGKIAGSHPRANEGPASAKARSRAAEALVSSLADPSLSGYAREALHTAGKAAAPALIAHLEGKIDGDPKAAVTLLRDLGDRDATPVLIEELGRGRLSQELVLDALSKVGDARATVPILGLLSSDDVNVRRRAMQALRPLLTRGDRAADVIARMVDDPDFEIRVMAVDYLGLMRAASAVPALVKLLGPGNKLRLRRAAVSALGEIADARATEPLLGILRDGPAPLRGPASRALVYIADPKAVPALIELANREDEVSRQHVLEVLGGVLRDKDDARARALLEKIAKRGRLVDSLAAIEALGAMRAKASSPMLRELASGQELHRRRAALRALGDIGDASATGDVAAAMDARDDRVSAAAAWALGKLGATGQLHQLLRAARGRGWATAINASAALVLLAPKNKDARAGLTKLLHHRLRQVRANAAEALARIGDDDAVPLLVRMLKNDTSLLARAAAARALGRLKKSAASTSALVAASKDDGADAVRDAAAAALKGPFTPPKRSDWRSFYVVDPDDADAPVRQEPYFVAAADGIVTAFYTDARGRGEEESYPPGDATVAAKSAQQRY